MKEFMVLLSNYGLFQEELIDFELRTYKQGYENETVKYMTAEGWELQYVVGNSNPHLIFVRDVE